MQRPYKALVMAMWFINLKSAVKYESLNAQEIGVQVKKNWFTDTAAYLIRTYAKKPGFFSKSLF